jgi:uncharacterized protein YegJ (DUF2314 family)
MPNQDFKRNVDESLFMAVDGTDPEYLATIQEARATLNTFESLFSEYKSNIGVYFAFKTSIHEGDHPAYLWYSLQSVDSERYYGKHFEIPEQFKEYSEVERTKEQILDWMINDHGVLYGGFSIRYQRSKVMDSRKAEFDKYAGIKEYEHI